VCVAVSSSSAPLPSVSESWRAAVFVQDVQCFPARLFLLQEAGLVSGSGGAAAGGACLNAGQVGQVGPRSR